MEINNTNDIIFAIKELAIASVFHIVKRDHQLALEKFTESYLVPTLPLNFQLFLFFQELGYKDMIEDIESSIYKLITSYSKLAHVVLPTETEYSEKTKQLSSEIVNKVRRAL